jgi:hypothetical protein
MPHGTTVNRSPEAVVQHLTERVTTIVRHLSDWVAQETPDVQQMEEHVLRAMKDLGGALLADLCHLSVPRYPPPTHPCPCGQTAAFQRLRPATCRTLLGPISIARPYYLCAACHHGFAPLDHQLRLCAGSRSAGLDELLALLGATQDSFAEAATVLDRLTLVEVAPNTVRAATEQLGAVLAEVEQAQVTALQAGHAPAVTPSAPAGPLCVSLDGVQAHLTPDGWKELCVGAVYQVRPTCSRLAGRVDAVHADAISYVAELGSRRDAFGWQLYAEAQRRGAATREVVVVGDGAAWLWTLADLHFPHATQILDWFHATEYVWSAASAIWGEGTADRTAWAERQLRALWEGQVGEVLAELHRQTAGGEAVSGAHTYFTNQQARMNYPAYRTRGLPIGSGTIESGCKQLVSARLKQAGMIWRAEGAQQVVKVRAWLKSGRWGEAMTLRPAPRRGYQRQPGRATTAPTVSKDEDGVAEGQTILGASRPPAPAAAPPALPTVPPEVLAAVQAELAQERAQHPWRRAWSRRQQRQDMERHRVEPAAVSSA